MLDINLTKSAQKFIKKQDRKQQIQIKNTLLALAENPYPHDSKKLKVFFPYHRSDVGEFRVIYRVESGTLYVAVVGKRNDGEVYKKMKNFYE